MLKSFFRPATALLSLTALTLFAVAPVQAQTVTLNFAFDSGTFTPTTEGPGSFAQGAVNENISLTSGLVSEPISIGTLTYSGTGSGFFAGTLARTASFAIAGVNQADGSLSYGVNGSGFIFPIGNEDFFAADVNFSSVGANYSLANGGTLQVGVIGNGNFAFGTPNSSIDVQATFLYTESAVSIAAPEPATLALLSIGAIGFVAKRRRVQK